MRVETERLYLYPISNDEMYSLIAKEADAEMKQAYTENIFFPPPPTHIFYFTSRFHSTPFVSVHVSFPS